MWKELLPIELLEETNEELFLKNGHTNAKYATKGSTILKVTSRILICLVLHFFFTRWLSFKLQLGVSSISLQVGCEPLVPLGLQNTKPCIQDDYHKI